MEIIIKSEEFSTKKTITDKNEPIIKAVNLKKYSGMLSEIYIQSMPEYMDKIMITAGNHRIFAWNRNEIEDCINNNTNIFEKYKLKEAIPISNNSYHNFKMNFIYNSEKVYNDCEIEKEEYIEKIASQDTSKIVEYWDMDDECVYQAYGVKYEEIKKVKKVITTPPKMNTPEVKLIFNSNDIDKEKNYKIEFFDDIIGQKIYLRYMNSMYEVVYGC